MHSACEIGDNRIPVEGDVSRYLLAATSAPTDTEDGLFLGKFVDSIHDFRDADLLSGWQCSLFPFLWFADIEDYCIVVLGPAFPLV